jgi:hypothetical protein
MQETPHLHSSFQDPALHAQFRILVALARSMRDALAQPASILAFETAGLGSNDLISHLGSIAASHIIDGIENVQEIDGIWDACFANPRIRYAPPACRKVLDAARSQSLIEVGKPDSFSDLISANRVAHRFVGDALRKHRLEGLLSPEPAFIEIFYDAQAKHFCAGSTRIAQKIRWAYQRVGHALEGLLLSDLVLAHEYLSHLVPLNTHLDQTVREGWLVSALEETFHLAPEVTNWKRSLWPQYRSDLYKHFLKVKEASPGVASVIRFEGFFGLKEQAIRLHAKSVSRFWKFTGAILQQNESPEGAQDISWLLNELVKSADRGLSLFVSTNRLTINELIESIQELE